MLNPPEDGCACSRVNGGGRLMVSYVKSQRRADVLLKMAYAASCGYVMYDGIVAWLSGIDYNVFLAIYLIIVPGFIITKVAMKRTVGSYQALCISLLGFAVVLYLTTRPQVWPAVYGILLVVLPSVSSFFLLERGRSA
jgi:hypothetical protein